MQDRQQSVFDSPAGDLLGPLYAFKGLLLPEEESISISLEALWSLIFSVLSHRSTGYKLISVLGRYRHTYALTQEHRKDNVIPLMLLHAFKCCSQSGTYTAEHTSTSPKKRKEVREKPRKMIYYFPLTRYFQQDFLHKKSR